MNTPVTPGQIERELQRQAQAEQRERTGSKEHDDPSIDHYRFINRAIRQAPIPALPAGFAARVARHIEDFEERAQFERSTLAVMVIIAVIAGLFFALPPLVEALQHLSTAIELPSAMLWATIFTLGFAAVLDQAGKRYKTLH